MRCKSNPLRHWFVPFDSSIPKTLSSYRSGQRKNDSISSHQCKRLKFTETNLISLFNRTKDWIYSVGVASHHSPLVSPRLINYSPFETKWNSWSITPHICFSRSMQPMKSNKIRQTCWMLTNFLRNHHLAPTQPTLASAAYQMDWCRRIAYNTKRASSAHGRWVDVYQQTHHGYVARTTDTFNFSLLAGIFRIFYWPNVYLIDIHDVSVARHLFGYRPILHFYVSPPLHIRSSLVIVRCIRMERK